MAKEGNTMLAREARLGALFLVGEGLEGLFLIAANWR